MLEIGTKVIWKARTGQRVTTRTGIVIALVPPRVDPMTVFDKQFRPCDLDPHLIRHMGHSKRREMSFLVMEDTDEVKPRVYCPVPKKLVPISVPSVNTSAGSGMLI